MQEHTKKRQVEGPSNNLHPVMNAACMHINLQCIYNHMCIGNKCAFLACVWFLLYNKNTQRLYWLTPQLTEHITEYAAH